MSRIYLYAVAVVVGLVILVDSPPAFANDTPVDHALPATAQPFRGLMPRSTGESTCWLDGTGAVRQRARWTIVDLRDRASFEQAHIPGSLSISAYALKSKTFLRDKPLLLVGEGYADRQLPGLCRELIQEGFRNVRILNGGVRAWQRSGGVLNGVVPDAIPQIPAKRIPLAFDPELWIVLHVGEKAPPKELKAYRPRNLMPATLSRGALEALMARGSPDAARRHGIEPTVLIIAEPERHGRLRQMLAGAKANVFFAEGAAEGLAEQSRIQRALLNKPDNVLQRPRNCD